MDQLGDFSYFDATASAISADSGADVASWLDQSPISALSSVTKKGRGTFNALNDLSTPTMHWEKQLPAASGKLDGTRDTGFGSARLFGAALADVKGRSLKENSARSSNEGVSSLWSRTFPKLFEVKKKEMEVLKNGKNGKAQPLVQQSLAKEPVEAKVGSAAKEEKVIDPWSLYKAESWEDELKECLNAQQAQKEKPAEVKIESAPKEEKVLDPWSLMDVKSLEKELKVQPRRTFGYRTPNAPIKQETTGKDPSEIRRTSFEVEDETENRPLPRIATAKGNAFFGKYNSYNQSHCPSQAKIGMFTPWGRRSTFAR